MFAIRYDERELAFLEQRRFFVQKVCSSYGIDPNNVLSTQPLEDPRPLKPTLVQDYTHLQSDEIASIVKGFNSRDGVAPFVVLNPDFKSDGRHPLLHISEQLRELLPVRYPVTHPMEGHPEAVKRFGPPDGTLKIYDLERDRPENLGYREIAETSEQFDAHNDGLGYGGAVEVFSLYADSSPIWGGYTYFQNIVSLSLTLLERDEEAFRSLFLPDAITALRPRGKGAIKVTSPCLYINEHGRPQTFFRLSTGEYQISWRNDDALTRARSFLERHATPFCPGSTFVQLNRPGAGCFARNEQVIHGRTAFLDGDHPRERRVLARKWFMSAPEHASYKHVPGMHILKPYADIYPERFGSEMLIGDWHLDPKSDTNVRVS